MLRSMRWLFVVLLVLAGAGLLAPAAQAAPAAAAPAPVQVSGAVATPAGYTAADLAALPQVSYPLNQPGGTVTGVDLRDLVLRAGPLLSETAKNPQLRVLLTVTARGRDVPFALGELDPDFGNHPAVLAVADGRVRLVVPGDRTPARTLRDVTGVRVAVSDAGPATPAAGSVVVSDGHRTATVSAQQLSRLPARTLTVDFQSGTGSQTHTERGPALTAVLAVAGMPVRAGTGVVAVGSDGYGAAVTLGEYYFGGRTLLLSTAEDGAALAQPRLITPGDVKGGRYVSGVVALTVG
jgi:hypothetical protein